MFQKKKGINFALLFCQVFVHVSTAFANSDLLHIEERVYTPEVQPQQVIEITK